MTFSFMQSSRRGGRFGFTLAEVIISVGIAIVGISGIVWGYVMCSRRAELAACSAAAQQMAMRRLEQTRAAKWDPFAYPPVDELQTSDFPPVVAPLDIPTVGGNALFATNVVTIGQRLYDPAFKVIRVDCTWSLPWVSNVPFTNTLVTYRASDR